MIQPILNSGELLHYVESMILNINTTQQKLDEANRRLKQVNEQIESHKKSKPQIIQNKKESRLIIEGRESWTYGDWEKKDVLGLTNMYKNSREAYDKLLNSWINKEHWNYLEWEKKDGEGLRQMYINNRARYNELFNKRNTTK